MKRLLLLLLYLVLPFFLFAQNGSIIKGIVSDKKTGEPLPGVNVFVSGTFNGTTTDIDGKFELTDITSGGQTLVISMVGYERIYQPIEKAKKLFNKTIEFKLKEKTYELDKVNIVVDEGDWKDYYGKFVREFIGERRYGHQCEILNPYSINFYYDDDTHILTADCDSMLTLINKGLGYKINFILIDFQFEYNLGSYTIEPLYEELTPTDSNEAKEWIENRNEAYYTSSRYFLKSLTEINVDRQEFIVYKKEYEYDEEGEKKYKYILFREVEAGDLDYEYDPVENYYIFDFMFDLLVVRYCPGDDEETILNFPNDIIFVRPDGSLVFIDDVVINGAWSKYRVSDLLPNEYRPPEEENKNE